MAILDEADEGKHVIGSTGVETGIIAEVRGEVSYLGLDAGLTGLISSVFGLREKESTCRIDAVIRGIGEPQSGWPVRRISRKSNISR
jgi:hypothetical protein